MSHTARIGIAVLQLLFLLPVSARAQPIPVRVLEDGSPVQGVLLSLINESGEVVGRTLTNVEGRGLLTAVEGVLRIRAELIGRQSEETAPFEVNATTLVAERLITLNPRPVELDAISVSTTGRCEVRPGAGRPADVVWNEARKALEAEQVTREDDLYRFDVEHFVRELDPTGRRVLSDQRRVAQRVSRNPFRSRPASELSDRGYLAETAAGDLLFAPTPDVLLSDAFLDTHCFYVTRSDSDASLIGLAFEAVADRTLPDVKGVLWLKAGTATLERLEFQYQNLPPRLPPGPYGGQATFSMLASGAWIVREWSIRTPVIGVSDTRLGNERVVGNQQLIGVQEEGARVVAIESRSRESRVVE